MSRVHVLAVLKMVRANPVVGVRFRAKISSPGVDDPFLGPVKNKDIAVVIT